jgi:hypothetical protein
MIRRLSIRLACFILPILLLLAGLEYLQRQLPNNYTHKRAQLEAQLDQWETLILGSSHSYLGVDPAALNSQAFNLAFTAQTLYFDQYLLASYLDRMPALKRVIVPISYGSLGSESYRNPGIYDKTYYYAQFYGSTAFTDWWDIERYSRVALFTTKRSVDRSMSYYTTDDSLLECRRDGFYTLAFQRDLDQNGQESGKFHDLYFDPSLIPTNLGYLDQMATLCAERGVTLCLISTPVWPSYLDHINPTRLAQTVSSIDSMRAARGIPYWNDMRDSTFEADDFYDANHLSAQGARQYTQRLQQRIDQWEQQTPLADSTAP